MIELGNCEYSAYYAEIRKLQTNTRLTVDLIGNSSAFQYNRPGVTRIFQHYKSFTLTDLVEIQSRFNRAINFNVSDNYHYGTFILQEEVWHPSLQVSWGVRKLSDWAIEGTLTLPNGTVLELLKNWYIRTKGTWNQTWWDAVKASNNPWETVVKEWSSYYGYTLMKAWHEFMHSLGKKSALVGLCGFSEKPENFRNAVKNYYFPGQMFDYVMKNYDLITTGIHPTTIEKIQDDILWLQVLRNEWNYKGKICHILTSCWGDNWGCPWNKDVAKEDFRQASQYIDMIIVTPFADTSYWLVPVAEIKNHVIYPPILVNFYDEYFVDCPPSQCDFTITQ